MNVLIVKHLALIGFICTFFIDVRNLDANDLKMIGSNFLNAPSTQSVYQDLIKEGKKKISPQPKKSLDSQPVKDEDYIKNAEMRLKRGDNDGAIDLYMKAIKANPSNFDSHFCLGNLLFNKGNFDLALEIYQKAASLNPNNSAVHHNIGLCLKKQEEIDCAIEHFKEAVRLKPDYIRAYMHWGILEVKRGKLGQALEIFNKALSINPNDATIQREVGCIYRDQNKFDKAIEAFSIAHTVEPNSISYIMELANTLSMIDKHDQSLQLYQRALELDPTLNSALYNIGYILKRKGYTEQAIEVFNKVLERAPNEGQAHFSLSLCHLTLGNFEIGWPEYEWRWQSYEETKPKVADKPYWDGSSLNGKTILLICEQGLGDTFQFIRYAKLLHQRGARIIVLAQKPVKTILQTGCSYIDQVILPGDPVPHFDYQVPLMSLPFMLNTRIETIPADIPYIKADPVLVTYWRTKLNTKTFNVGICWQGNAQYRSQLLQLVVAAKSTTLENFKELTRVGGCTFYSLQKINGTEQLDAVGNNLSIVDFGTEIDEEHGRFMDTAAIIMNLDLVITIDTSIGHLAAALGKPTWILLPNPADWRWMLTRNDTPWYPNVRLFRQQTRGDWASTMNEVEQALQELVSAGKTVSLKTQVTASREPIQQKSIEPAARTKNIEQAVIPDKAAVASETLPIDEFIDTITIQAIKADTSINMNELSTLMERQGKNQERYNNYLKTMPRLKDLTLCLLDSNKLLHTIEKKIKQLSSIFNPEYEELITQSKWIIVFKNNIKREIKKLDQNKTGIA